MVKRDATKAVLLRANMCLACLSRAAHLTPLLGGAKAACSAHAPLAFSRAATALVSEEATTKFGKVQNCTTTHPSPSTNKRTRHAHVHLHHTHAHRRGLGRERGGGFLGGGGRLFFYPPFAEEEGIVCAPPLSLSTHRPPSTRAQEGALSPRRPCCCRRGGGLGAAAFLDQDASLPRGAFAEELPLPPASPPMPTSPTAQTAPTLPARGPVARPSNATFVAGLRGRGHGRLPCVQDHLFLAAAASHGPQSTLSSLPGTHIHPPPTHTHNPTQAQASQATVEEACV